MVEYVPKQIFLPYPFLPPNCDKPPTVYSIMESIIKYKNKDNIKIVNLAKETHSMIFDFEYPLSKFKARDSPPLNQISIYLDKLSTST